MFSFAVSFVFITLIIGSADANNSPVLLWGTELPSQPALTTLKKDAFQDLIAPLLKNYTIVVFLENNLTFSDFRCKKLDTTESCYAFLSHVSPRTFYVRVEEPLQVLLAMANTEPISNTVDAAGKLQSEIFCQTPGGVNFISFNDSITDRQQQLELHDSTVAIISQQQTCPVIFLYMSASSTQYDPTTSITQYSPRFRRGNIAARSPGGSRGSNEVHYMYNSDHFVIYFTKIVLKGNDGKMETELKINSIKEDKLASGEMKITLIGGPPNIDFVVQTVKGYAIVKTFHLDDVPYRAFDVETPLKFSYYCGQLRIKANESSSFLIFSKLQFQVLAKGYHDNFKFGPAWHCVGFVTPAILSGIFILAIMITIAFCGVCCIMDIHTNDRFEDPKSEKFQAARGVIHD